MSQDAALKRKITERWNLITRGQTHNPFGQGHHATAFAQLEYILIEAGLLARRRAPQSRDGKRKLEEIQRGTAELPLDTNLESERFSAKAV